jgi:hypothetical protein
MLRWMARHLPIAGQKQAPPPGTVASPEEERPPWHWSAIGAVLVFTAWLPLAMIGQWLSARLVGMIVPAGVEGDTAAALAVLPPDRRALLHASLVGPQIVMFLLATYGGGFLVGRFGGKAGAKEAAVAGVLAASTAWALTAASQGLGRTFFLWPPVALLGLVGAYLGGRHGVRSRRNEATGAAS